MEYKTLTFRFWRRKGRLYSLQGWFQFVWRLRRLTVTRAFSLGGEEPLRCLLRNGFFIAMLGHVAHQLVFKILQREPRKYPDNLLETHIEINKNCGPFEVLLNEHSFCAGYNGSSSGCVGDSGGPLVCARSSGDMYTRFEISGVSSWSGRSCYPANPTGFMKGTIQNTLNPFNRFFFDFLLNLLKVYSTPILDFIQRIISNI